MTSLSETVAPLIHRVHGQSWAGRDVLLPAAKAQELACALTNLAYAADAAHNALEAERDARRAYRARWIAQGMIAGGIIATMGMAAAALVTGGGL